MADYKYVDQENLKTVVRAIKSNYTTKETTNELSNNLESEVLRAQNREQEILDIHEENMEAIEDRADKIEEVIKDGVGVMDVLVDGNSIMKDKKVNLYFFRGEGCSHCAEAEAWFEDTLEKEYGDYFKIVDYEVWYNEDNASLMQKVADARGETAEGVPYIIIGDKSWNGFDTSYEDAIIEQIKKVYAQDVSERYDIMNYLDTEDSKKDSSTSDIIALVAIILVVGGIGTGIYFARKSNSNN